MPLCKAQRPQIMAAHLQSPLVPLPTPYLTALSGREAFTFVLIVDISTDVPFPPFPTSTQPLTRCLHHTVVWATHVCSLANA